MLPSWTEWSKIDMTRMAQRAGYRTACTGRFRARTEGLAPAGGPVLAGRARFRDVRIGPDGAIYVLTDESTGELLKLVPLTRRSTAEVTSSQERPHSTRSGSSFALLLPARCPMEVGLGTSLSPAPASNRGDGWGVCICRR